MKDQELGDYYRIKESDAKLHGFKLTATDTNDAVQLQSTTVAGFTFTNTYADTGRDLTLKKIVSAPDTTGSFTFTVSDHHYGHPQGCFGHRDGDHHRRLHRYYEGSQHRHRPRREQQLYLYYER